MSDNLPSCSETLLALAARHWQPGKVQPGLAQTLGESHAAMVHALFVVALIERLAAVGERRLVAYAPAEAERAFRAVVKGKWELAPQADGEAGRHLEQVLAAGLQSARRVVLVGADCPDLPRELIGEAFAALGTHDVVLGPSAEGGCYLVGVARRVPPLVPIGAWGTPDAWSQITGRAAAAGVAWHELAPWNDVQDGAGLQDLNSRLSTSGASDARLAQLQRELTTLLGPQLHRTVKVHMSSD
jgi:glycosyltransferase A (GT-A) superfamily protein (DUF2064 family)